MNMTGQFQYQKAGSFVWEPFAVQFQSEKTGGTQDTKDLRRGWECFPLSPPPPPLLRGERVCVGRRAHAA